jgi:hypothetical protein
MPARMAKSNTVTISGAQGICRCKQHSNVCCRRVHRPRTRAPRTKRHRLSRAIFNTYRYSAAMGMGIGPQPNCSIRGGRPTDVSKDSSVRTLNHIA